MGRRSFVAGAALSVFLVIGAMPSFAAGGRLPDLKETGVTWKGARDCSHVDIRVDVENVGTETTGVSTVFTYLWSFDFHTYDRVRFKVRPLEPGQVKQITFSIPYRAGSYMDNIFIVDARDDVVEADETNNETSDLDVYCF
jgi:subtilase family serine protease